MLSRSSLLSEKIPDMDLNFEIPEFLNKKTGHILKKYLIFIKNYKIVTFKPNKHKNHFIIALLDKLRGLSGLKLHKTLISRTNNLREIIEIIGYRHSQIFSYIKAIFSDMRYLIITFRSNLP